VGAQGSAGGGILAAGCGEVGRTGQDTAGGGEVGNKAASEWLGGRVGREGGRLLRAVAHRVCERYLLAVCAGGRCTVSPPNTAIHLPTITNLPQQRATPVDPRLTPIVLNALPVYHSSEAALMPGLMHKLAERELIEQREREEAAAAVAEAEADLANLLSEGSGEDEGGVEEDRKPQQQQQQQQQQVDQPTGGESQPHHRPPPPSVLVSDQPAVSNMFGPGVETIYVMDPLGSMTGPCSAAGGGAGGGGRGNPGAPLLQQLLSQCALQLQPRIEPALERLPDAGEESVGDQRVATWREALAPSVQQVEPEAVAAVQQQQLQSAAAAGAPGVQDDEWWYDDAAVDPTDWMAHVPSAPQRDDAGQAALAGERGGRWREGGVGAGRGR